MRWPWQRQHHWQAGLTDDPTGDFLFLGLWCSRCGRRRYFSEELRYKWDEHLPSEAVIDLLTFARLQPHSRLYPKREELIRYLVRLAEFGGVSCGERAEVAPSEAPVGTGAEPTPG